MRDYNELLRAYYLDVIDKHAHMLQRHNETKDKCFFDVIKLSDVHTIIEESCDLIKYISMIQNACVNADKFEYIYGQIQAQHLNIVLHWRKIVKDCFGMCHELFFDDIQETFDRR